MLCSRGFLKVEDVEIAWVEVGLTRGRTVLKVLVFEGGVASPSAQTWHLRGLLATRAEFKYTLRTICLELSVRTSMLKLIKRFDHRSERLTFFVRGRQQDRRKKRVRCKSATFKSQYVAAAVGDQCVMLRCKHIVQKAKMMVILIVG